MTTLELAGKIALAVRHAEPLYGTGETWHEARTLAVLRTLQENNSWFCRVDPAKAEDWPEEQEERYEMVPPDLFK